jgi:deazaflavin-dependent oxidoreductase (nitroreductase family)
MERARTLAETHWFCLTVQHHAVARLYRSSAYRAMLPRVLRLFGPVHVGLYRLFRGRVVGRMSQGFMPLLLLTTIGRKSGRPRTQPVGYLRDGPGFLLVGSNGALTSDPGWIFNLRARPEAEIELDGERMHVRARILVGDERLHAWRDVTSRYGFFSAYQGAVRRSIPLVRLEPAPLSGR